MSSKVLIKYLDLWEDYGKRKLYTYYTTESELRIDGKLVAIAWCFDDGSGKLGLDSLKNNWRITAPFASGLENPHEFVGSAVSFEAAKLQATVHLLRTGILK